MTSSDPSVLDHDLAKHFPELLKFESTPEMEGSEMYTRIRPEVERILNAVVSEPRAVATGLSHGTASTKGNPVATARGSDMRALAWNIERGNIFDGIVDALLNHDQLKEKDVLLLTELDYGMARSGNRFVAQEIAQRLNLNYAFAPVYIALQKGSGVESESEGENTKSIHGLAMFSKWPIKNVHAIPLPNGKDKMWGKEKRLGYLRALFADVEHPAGTFRAVTVHLDAHCSRMHRHRQMKIILDHLDTLAAAPDLDRRRLEHDDIQRTERDAGDPRILAAGDDGCEECGEEPLTRTPIVISKRGSVRELESPRLRVQIAE